MKVLSNNEIQQISGGTDPLVYLLIACSFGLGLSNTFKLNELDDFVTSLSIMSFYQELQLSWLPGYEESMEYSPNQVIDILYS